MELSIQSSRFTQNVMAIYHELYLVAVLFLGIFRHLQNLRKMMVWLKGTM